MIKINLLFSGLIPEERLEWTSELLKEFVKRTKSNNIIRKINLFLSGDALFSLIDKRVRDYWLSILKSIKIQIVIDYSELNILGHKIDMPNVRDSSKINVKDNTKIDKLDFWKRLIEESIVNKHDSKFGFLQLEGPYMHRTSVYALRVLRAALKNNLKPEFYGYLDGVHMGHKGQQPSEFENIAEELLTIKNLANKKGHDFLMLACSRCGTARGYKKSQFKKDYINSDDVISSYNFCNLNKIINQFENKHLIYSSNSASIINDELKNQEISFNSEYYNAPPPIMILLTHSPYGLEWTFGGLSFAMACANHGIPTQIVFIEDGSYSIVGNHNIKDAFKIFNVHDIIEATSDMDNLEYYAYSPSLKRRGLTISRKLESVNLINKNSLSDLFLHSNNRNFFHKRVIFF